MENKIEFEEVVVRVPKAIMTFLREHMPGKRLERYLQSSVISTVRADMETNEVFVPSPLELANKYDLQPIFKKFDTELFYVDC